MTPLNTRIVTFLSTSDYTFQSLRSQQDGMCTESEYQNVLLHIISPRLQFIHTPLDPYPFFFYWFSLISNSTIKPLGSIKLFLADYQPVLHVYHPAEYNRIQQYVTISPVSVCSDLNTAVLLYTTVRYVCSLTVMYQWVTSIRHYFTHISHTECSTVSLCDHKHRGVAVSHCTVQSSLENPHTLITDKLMQ